MVVGTNAAMRSNALSILSLYSVPGNLSTDLFQSFTTCPPKFKMNRSAISSVGTNTITVSKRGSSSVCASQLSGQWSCNQFAILESFSPFGKGILILTILVAIAQSEAERGNVSLGDYPFRVYTIACVAIPS